MDSDANNDSADEDNTEMDDFENDNEDTVNASDSSDSESEPEDSGFSNNENGGSQELTLLDDGPSVLIQHSILDDEADGEDGKTIYMYSRYRSYLVRNFSTKSQRVTKIMTTSSPVYIWVWLQQEKNAVQMSKCPLIQHPKPLIMTIG